ncbi:MAG: NAD-dependent epimerase/dehydratase family protein [Anaerolineales bacterium]|nr:NAD-dependent epimerase/dehydratase family protein [Anaerolineales bacterium]
MKALITGGNGFIGSHLVDRLVREKWEVDILDPCQRNFGRTPPEVRQIQKKLEAFFPNADFLTETDVVFHLAWTTIIESATRDPVFDIKTNLIPFLKLLNACRQAKVRKVVFISSGGTIYGPSKMLPIPESHTLNPINPYGISKLAAEKYLQMYGALYGLDYSILRPSSAYGPRQNPKGKQGAVTVFLYRVAHNLPVTIWGDGQVIRDYVYISDLVDALFSSARCNSSNNRIFNIGGGENISLVELLKRVEKTVEKRAIVEYLPSRDFDAQEIRLDTELAHKELDWHPKVMFAEGLLKTWGWISSLEN